MEVDDRRLDGNAAGGLLGEVFPFEMTTAEVVCAGCGARAPVGAVMVYPHGMGMILRCAGCDTALIRITHIRGCYRLDPSGMSCLRIDSGIH